MPPSVPSWLTGTALPWLSEEASAFGQGPLIVADAAQARLLADSRPELGTAILIGTDEKAALPQTDDIFDLYLTTAPAPPRPWVQVQSVPEALAALSAAINANPNAAVILIQVLRAQRNLPFETALTIESLAYSALLGGAEFRRWRAASPAHAHPQEAGPAVRIARDGETMHIRLARPQSGNATTAELRDALVEALREVRIDDTIRTVEIRGEGRVFSQGGALGEFGTAEDLALAHHLRMVRSAALTLHRVKALSRVFIQGAAVGGGIEFAAAAREVVARPSAFFQLPELAMGLIPGAGGTVTLARRIGWQRTAYLVLSGARLRARTALAWELVDRLEDD
jgi:enoyl-CoA hydratase/carnithine racemase